MIDSAVSTVKERWKDAEHNALKRGEIIYLHAVNGIFSC